MSGVRDNTTRHRFELDVGGITAFIDYRRQGDIVTFVHTEVPDALSGKGVGSQLVRGALDLVRSRGEKLVAECPFTAAYIKKHPEYQDLLAEPLH
jgi:predicted GNAT family acetyltransferase